MYTPFFTVTPTILTSIEQIGRILGYLQAVRLPAGAAQEILAQVEAETVHASTAIEGNTLTQEQVTAVLAGRTVQALARDIQEVKNYQATLSYIHEIAAVTDTFSHQTVLELHYRLLQGVDDEAAGRYRTSRVRVGDYLPPDPYEVHALMNDFVAWLNAPAPQGYSHLLYAGIAHYQFVAVHPFTDGNGRTARALTTLYLLKHGYDITRAFALESHYNRDRAAYYAALHAADVTVTAGGERDLTPWLDYFVGGMLVEAARAESRVRTYRPAAPVPLPVRLTETQRTILAVTARLGTAASSDYAGELAISTRGIRKAAGELVDDGLLARSGAKRGTTYRLTPAGRRAVEGLSLSGGGSSKINT
ncbi:MAG: Fic family protein [Caldilinea sp.]|nr:Fic family protein [Caldilinea sp.]